MSTSKPSNNKSEWVYTLKTQDKGTLSDGYTTYKVYTQTCTKNTPEGETPTVRVVDVHHMVVESSNVSLETIVTLPRPRERPGTSGETTKNSVPPMRPPELRVIEKDGHNELYVPLTGVKDWTTGISTPYAANRDISIQHGERFPLDARRIRFLSDDKPISLQTGIGSRTDPTMPTKARMWPKSHAPSSATDGRGIAAAWGDTVINPHRSIYVKTSQFIDEAETALWTEHKLPGSYQLSYVDIRLEGHKFKTEGDKALSDADPEDVIIRYKRDGRGKPPKFTWVFRYDPRVPGRAQRQQQEEAERAQQQEQNIGRGQEQTQAQDEQTAQEQVHDQSDRHTCPASEGAASETPTEQPAIDSTETTRHAEDHSESRSHCTLS